MNKHKLPHGIVKNALALADQMEALKCRKNPVFAGVAGFALGSIGLGLFFQSWIDFVVSSLIALAILILSIPFGGVPALFIPLFLAAYGYRRARASNAKLEKADADILDVEIVASPTRKAQGTNLLTDN